MTLTTLITLNAVLAATVVFGIVLLLASAIASDRDARRALRPALSEARRAHDRGRLAA